MNRIGPPKSLKDLLAWHENKRDTAAKTAKKYEDYAVQWEAKHGKRCCHSRRMENQNTTRAEWHASAVNVIKGVMP